MLHELRTMLCLFESMLRFIDLICMMLHELSLYNCFKKIRCVNLFGQRATGVLSIDQYPAYLAQCNIGLE
jgi:hypothetical protein